MKATKKVLHLYRLAHRRVNDAAKIQNVVVVSRARSAPARALSSSSFERKRRNPERMVVAFAGLWMRIPRKRNPDYFGGADPGYYDGREVYT